VRILAGLGLAITFVSLWASAASAHVTIQPSTAEQGSYGRFVFRVPDESATASTIKLEVQTPTDKPLTGVRVQPKQGWTVELTKTKLDTPIKGEGADITEYVSKISWVAQEGYKIAPDQFDEFGFSVGPLPKDQAQIAFKAVQTYDGPLTDGTTEARWVEVRQTGQPDPKRPEPLLKLTPPTTTANGATPASAAVSGTDSGSAAATTAQDAKDAASSAKTLGVIGLILGIIALLAAIGAIVAKPRATPRPAAPADA
jgi:uncharacterized protein YcnI